MAIFQTFPKAAPILLTNVSGLLTGATGVDVDGAL